MGIKGILRKELIGCDIKIGNDIGKIIDETKNMLTIGMKNGKKKKFIKKNNLFEVIVGDGIVKVDGKKILLRPEERTKIK